MNLRDALKSCSEERVWEHCVFYRATWLMEIAFREVRAWQDQEIETLYADDFNSEDRV